MTNEKNHENENSASAKNPSGDDNFSGKNSAQNIGGGHADERTIDAGERTGGEEFNKTDQSIAQAAPGQTATATDQGSSNA